MEEKTNGKPTLRELVEKLEWEKAHRYDIIVPTEQLKVQYDVGTKVIKMWVPQPDTTMKTHGITEHAHNQIGEKCKIPAMYYERMRQNKPELLAENINAWLPDKEKRLVRVDGSGNVRALLGAKYRCIDNVDILYASLDEFRKLGETGIQIDVPKATATETHLYIKATSPSLVDEVHKIQVDHTRHEFLKNPEPVQGGLIITNSEVGNGAFRVEPYMNVLVCTNGLIREKVFRRVHLGRDQDIGIIDWSDETRQLEDMALWSKIRDMIRNTFNPEIFHSWVDEINKTAGNEISKPVIAVDNIIREFKLPQNQREALLNQFMVEGNTQWGLSMAVTQVAQKLGSYEQQIEWEKAGAKILTMRPEVLVKEITVNGNGTNGA